MLKPTVLVIDDEKDLIELVRYNLEKEGFLVKGEPDGESGKAAAVRDLPDIIIVDLMLPGIDGLEVCRRLRADARTAGIPIIMLTAKASEIDRVLGLELGADDYVTKPFSPRELVLRVKNVLQRHQQEVSRPEHFALGDLVIDLPRHEVLWKGRAIELTATEFRLLTVLAERAGRVQSRDQLLQDVWHYESVIDTRTVDTHMRRLREKLGPAAKHLDTVRGVGYRFVE